MNPDSNLAAAFAPTGMLRAAINLGNPVLAYADPATHKPAGVSVDLARVLAERLGVEVELVAFDTAGRSVDAVMREEADVGFFAIDPLRGEGIAFTAPYVLIEGAYMVRDDSPIVSNEQVDRAGVRVAVGKGSAYDLFLSRELKSAEIVRAPSSPAVIELFVDQRLEVAAGIRQQLEAESKKLPGMRLLPDRFMVIRQAMGLPKGRGRAAADFLRHFVEDMKAGGGVADALARHHVDGVSVAPPEHG